MNRKLSRHKKKTKNKQAYFREPFLKSFTITNTNYKFKRYPETSNRSLRAWSAADEYILLKLEERDLTSEKVAIYNDRFGFLSCTLNEYEPQVIVERKSQQRSIEQNMKLNELQWDKERQCTPLHQLQEKVNVGIINIPKTMDLFRLYLDHLSRYLKDDGMVICSFMTKYFSPQMLDIAGGYFEEVEQSLARKKSRLLILKNKKARPKQDLFHTIPFTFEGRKYDKVKQYFGVFSSDHIDYATQFLIEHLVLDEEDKKVMDLASGNGVIGKAIQIRKPKAELHLMDDSLLAIESSKMNLDTEIAHFHWNDRLDGFEENSFDLVVSNPPFHFGHETNIEVTLELFRGVANILTPRGQFICVANQHLNYKTHLDKLYATVEVIAQNKKFILFSCRL